MRRIKKNLHSSRLSSLQTFDVESATLSTVERPSLSYTTLIANAIRDSPRGRLVLAEIYQHIMDSHLYYRLASPGWKNSVRHALSASPMFINMAACSPPSSLAMTRVACVASQGQQPLVSSRRCFEWGFNPAHELESRQSSIQMRHAVALQVGDDDGSASVMDQGQWPFGAESTKMLQEAFQSMAGGISDVLPLDPPRAASDGNHGDGSSFAICDALSRSYCTVGVETDSSLLAMESSDGGRSSGVLSMAELSDSLFGTFKQMSGSLEDQLKNSSNHHCAIKRSHHDRQSSTKDWDRDVISDWFLSTCSVVLPGDDWLTPAFDSNRWSD